MAASLPKTAQLKIRQALGQWRHWLCEFPLVTEPVLSHRLDGGLSNTSVLVSAGDQRFVVRLDGDSPERLGLSRAAEWRAHRNAAVCGLAPSPVYFNPELGVLVTEFCPCDEVPLSGSDEIDAIAELLRGIHALPAVKFRLQPMDRAQHYLGLLGDSSLPLELHDACTRLQRTAPACLCHNDLLRENRLQSGGALQAIDWEYTAMGDPWFDLAVICEGEQLSEAQQLALCEAYLQGPPDSEQLQRLQDNRVAYRHLAVLWQRLTGN